MKRRILTAFTAVLLLAVGFTVGMLFGSTSSDAALEAPGDTSHCAAESSGRAAEPSADVTTTSGPSGFVYDPDGPGPGLPQVPLDGYDPLNPTGFPPGTRGGDAAGPAGDESGHVLTYDPLGTQQGDTYTVFADLVAAAASVQGGGTIFVPNDAVIDAPGEYDLNYFGFASNGSTRGFTRTILTIPDGVTFTNPGYMLAHGGIILYSTSSSAVVDHTATSYESSRMFILENDGMIASKTAAFFTLTAASNTSIIFFSLRHGGGIAKPSDLGIPGGDYESILANPGDGAVVIADVAPPLNFYDGTVRGPGNIDWTRYTTAIPYQRSSYARGRLQPNADAFIEHIHGNTALSLHDQADPDSWINADRSTTAASLDELACRLHALENP